MSKPSAAQVVAEYRDQLQTCISIVCNTAIRPSTYKMGELGVLSNEPCRLRGRSDLYLSFVQQYKVEQDDPPAQACFKIRTAHYKYTIEDSDGNEIFGYHWHPDGKSPVRFPHLHLGAGAQINHQELGPKAHFPTSRVPFEDVVALLIDTFNVEANTSDWKQLLWQSKESFKTKGRWWVHSEPNPSSL